MSDAGRDNDGARQEAAGWFTRLSRRSVTTQEIREFREWRRQPGNRRAYEQVEKVWNQAGELAGDPDIEALRAETRQATLKPRLARRPALNWAAAAVAVLVLVGAGASVVTRLPPAYDSKVGEQRILRLADGSTLRLNTDSRVVVHMGRDARRIRLERGEAMFEVAHDPSRPFLVEADGAVVRAVGTVFNVRLSSGHGVGVTLLEGVVQVQGAGGRQLTLRPNERVQVRDGVLQASVPTDARRATGWTERRLTFERTPLAEAIAEVNRYSPDKIELAAADLAQAPVNGVFETGDARTFAAAVASVFDLQATPQGEHAIVLTHTRPAVP